MGKFVIECPSCGNYAQAKTGFFAKKKIDCTCGYIIDIKVDKMVTRECPHCKNVFIHDQSKGSNVKCPVCRQPVFANDRGQKVEEISCAQCGIRLVTSVGASTHTCPVCDYVNVVSERIVSEKIKNDGLASVIKYEGDNNIFIWKHPIEDFNYGSQLIVHESQEAIFFRDGQALDLFGPGRYTLETQQLPLLEKAYKLPTDTEGTFHSEVYFINKTVQMAVKWGTPEKIRFIDPLTGTPLQIGASGEMNIKVDNGRKLLLKLVGTTKGISWDEGSGLTKSLQASFRPLIVNAVKSNFTQIIKEQAIDLLEIDEKLDFISSILKDKIKPGFEDYGLTIEQFYVNNVVLPEEDPNFKRIKELHTITLQTRVIQAEATIKTAQAQSETVYRTAQEQSKAAIEAARREAEIQRQMTETEIARREAERTIIEAQAQAQAMRMQGLTEAEIMKAKGYSEKDVLQAEVQKAYAEGIGNMGPTISSGGGGSIVSDMVGLGVGMAAAGTIAPQLGGMLQNMSIQSQQNTPSSWDCTCGQTGIISNFCPNCGNKKPELKPANSWDCSCGQTGITGNFCPNCGTKKPEEKKSWDCTCGQTGITGNFCPNCGSKKPEEKTTWDCNCGQTGNSGKFCNNCGKPKGA